LTLTWKSPKPNTLEVAVPLRDAAPGPVTLEIKQFGLENPDKLTLMAYAEAASLERMTLSTGDLSAVLTGTRLDEVAKASLNKIAWTPTTLKRVQDIDHLELKADGSTADLEPGKHYFATVELRDGRKLKTPVRVDAPRPEVVLLSKGTQDEASSEPSPVRLGSPDDLPVEQRLVFFLKSKTPANFPRDQKIEVAAVDGSFRTILSVSDGTLMLEDANTALGVVEPLARFGSSAFGPVRARAVSSEGVTGEWVPLGTLIRLPGFKELRCPRAVTKPCTLTGTNLFLAALVAATPDFDNATDVPPDFTGTQLTVPHSADGVLYVRLRDDPMTVQTVSMTVTPQVPSTALPAPAKATPPSQSDSQPAQTSVQPPPTTKTEP
jgi:hypothetical protein